MKLIKLGHEDLIAENIESITKIGHSEWGIYSFDVIMKSGKRNHAGYFGHDRETQGDEIKEIHCKLLEYLQNTDTSVFDLESLLHPPTPVPYIKPKIGVIVIYVSPKCEVEDNDNVELSPAIIVKCYEISRGCVNLKVLLDGEKDVWVQGVMYSQTNEPGTWHWLPKS